MRLYSAVSRDQLRSVQAVVQCGCWTIAKEPHIRSGFRACQEYFTTWPTQAERASDVSGARGAAPDAPPMAHQGLSSGAFRDGLSYTRPCVRGLVYSRHTA